MLRRLLIFGLILLPFAAHAQVNIVPKNADRVVCLDADRLSKIFKQPQGWLERVKAEQCIKGEASAQSPEIVTNGELWSRPVQYGADQDRVYAYKAYVMMDGKRIQFALAVFEPLRPVSLVHKTAKPLMHMAKSPRTRGEATRFYIKKNGNIVLY